MSRHCYRRGRTAAVGGNRSFADTRSGRPGCADSEPSCPHPGTRRFVEPFEGLGATVVEFTGERSAAIRTVGPRFIPLRCAAYTAFYFEIVIGIPTFSIRPIVVWNRTLSIRKVVRSHTVSFTE